MDNHTVGPFYIEGNLIGSRYLELLRNHIEPATCRLFPNPNSPLMTAEDIWFQKDGVPALFALAVGNHLNEIFSGRWIGRRGAMDWPPWSPDLMLMDFFL